ncbi:MAG: hypothetical protein ACTHKC_06185 [Candidatus Nitrosocosmicus sp.]
MTIGRVEINLLEVLRRPFRTFFLLSYKRTNKIFRCGEESTKTHLDGVQLYSELKGQ